eukprot:6184874-Pleurochrysis_carterae.AAC.4
MQTCESRHNHGRCTDLNRALGAVQPLNHYLLVYSSLREHAHHGFRTKQVKPTKRVERFAHHAHCMFDDPA